MSILWPQSKLSLGAPPSLPVMTILALPHTSVSATVLCHYKGGLQNRQCTRTKVFSCKLNRRVKDIFLPSSSSCCNQNLTILALTSAKALIMSSIFNDLRTLCSIEIIAKPFSLSWDMVDRKYVLISFKEEKLLSPDSDGQSQE